MIIPGGQRIDTAVALAAHLRDQIISGRIVAGQRLPSEVALMQTYGLARGTVSKAVRALRSEGLATHIRGYGVVVRESVGKEDVTPEPGATVDVRMPSPEEITKYGLAEGVPVFVVVDEQGAGQVYPADRYRLRIE